MRACGFLAVLVVLVLSSRVLAFDVDGARNYVKEAIELIARKDYAGASSKLDLAEAELDGVDSGTKATIEQSIAAARKQIADMNSGFDKAKYTRELDRALTDAEASIGNLATWAGASARLEAIFNDPKAQAAIGPEMESAKKKFETYKKLNARKASGLIAEQLETNLANTEKEWADTKSELTNSNVSAEGRERAIRSLNSSIDLLKRQLAQLPQEDPRYAGFESRINAMVVEGNKISGSGQVSDVLAQLKRFWDMDGSYFEGWEKETTGPTWAEYREKSSQSMSAFNAPQSAALITRIDTFLKNRENDEAYKAAAGDAQVIAFMDDLKTKQARAREKLLKFASDVVDGADRDTPTTNNLNDYQRLDDSLRVTLGDDNAEGKALRERVKAKLDAYDQATMGAEKEVAEWYKKSTEAAAAKWPEMKAKFEVSEGFDPTNPGAFKGKLILIETDNLMGYRFKPGDFQFATTLSGMPIAGRYSPAVAGAIQEIEKKMKRGLGDSDDDGRWEIIARVEGSTGQMMARKTAEGDLKIDGQTVGKYTGEYAEPVTAPIITILAAHVGPLAVADGQGLVTSDGSIASATTPMDTGAASGMTTSVGGGAGLWLMRFLHLIVGLVAAAAALLAAGFKPTPKVAEVSSQLGSKNIAFIGLACVGWGVLWLLLGFIYRGFLVNAAIISAGGYAALSMLQNFGVIKPDIAAKIKPLGIPIGLACAGIVVFSFFIGGRFIII